MKSDETSGTLHRQARKGWLWGCFEQFAQRGLSMLVSLVLARMLAPEAFGLIASVSIFLTTAQQLIDGGLAVRVVQKKDIQEEDYVAFFWCNATVSLLTCGLLAAGSKAIAGFYGNPQMRPVTVVMAAVVFLMNAGRVQELRLIRELRFKIISLVTISSVAAGCVTGLVLAFAGGGIWAILGQQLVMSLVRAASFWRLVPWRPLGKPSLHAVKDLYAFGMPVVISQTIRGFSEQLVNVLTARYVGMAPLGYYDRGRFIPGNAASFIQSIFIRTNLTVLSKLQHHEEEFRDAYLRLIGSISSVCLIIMTGLAVCAPEIVEVVLGSKWLPSVWFFRAGCVMSSFYFFFTINQDVLKAKGLIFSLFWQNILYAGLQVAGVGLGLFGGLRGMVVGSISACMLSGAVLMIVISRKSCITFGSQLKAFLLPAGQSLLLACGLVLAKQIGPTVWTRFLLCGIAGMIGIVCVWRANWVKKA